MLWRRMAHVGNYIISYVLYEVHLPEPGRLDDQRTGRLQVRDLPCPLLGDVGIVVGGPAMPGPARFPAVGHVEEETLD